MCVCVHVNTYCIVPVYLILEYFLFFVSCSQYFSLLLCFHQTARFHRIWFTPRYIQRLVFSNICLIVDACIACFFFTLLPFSTLYKLHVHVYNNMCLHVFKFIIIFISILYTNIFVHIIFDVFM